MNSSPMVPMTAIIELIKACRDNGVRQFEHAGLKLSFDAQLQEVRTTIVDPMMHADPIAMKDQLERAELQAKEEELERLRLEDPLAYEELVHRDLDMRDINE